MRRAYYRKYVYHTLLAIIAALLYLWQNSVAAFPEIASLRALPLIPFIICVTMFNPDKAGVVYGVTAGIVMDISWSKTSGFNAVCLFIICVACGLLIRLLFNRTLLTALFLNGIVCLVYFSLYWLFYCKLAGLEDSGYCFFNYYLPMMIYTWAFTIPFYLMTRFITSKFRTD